MPVTQNQSPDMIQWLVNQIKALQMQVSKLQGEYMITAPNYHVAAAALPDLSVVTGVPPGQGSLAVQIEDNTLQYYSNGIWFSVGQLAVTDGTTQVQPTNVIYFASGATVTDLGGGEAQIDIAGGGGGIQYDYDNSGDWLYVVTTAAESSISYTDPYGMVSGTYGTLFLSEGPADLLIQQYGFGDTGDRTAFLLLDVGGEALLYADSVLYLAASEINLSDYIQIQSTAGQINYNSDIYVPSTLSFTTNAVYGEVTLRLDSDGSIHGRRGIGAITWDLP